MTQIVRLKKRIHDFIDQQEKFHDIWTGYEIDLDNPANNSLHLAASFGETDIIHILLALGFDPNIIDDKGLLPLNYAIRNGQLNAAKLLVKFGSKINVISQSDYNDFYTKRIGSGEIDIDKTLLALKLESENAMDEQINIVNNLGFTALDISLSRGYNSVSSILRANGAEESVREPIVISETKNSNFEFNFNDVILPSFGNNYREEKAKAPSKSGGRS